MKNKVIITAFALLAILPKSYSQNNNAAAIGAIAGIGIMAIGAHLAIEEYKEILEASATEYYLQMGNEGMFNISLLQGEGASWKDMSKTSMQVFAITTRQLNEETKTEEITSRKIMTVFITNSAWANENGIVWSEVDVKIWNRSEWTDLYLSYLSIASPLKLSDPQAIPVMDKVSKKVFDSTDGIKFSIASASGRLLYYSQGGYVMGLHNKHLITADGIQIPTSDSWKTVMPFYRFDGDTYIVKDYNVDYKIAYNEKRLGIYIKSTGELVQLKRNILGKIANFFW